VVSSSKGGDLTAQAGALDYVRERDSGVVRLRKEYGKEIVTQNRIVYGRVQVTLPMPVKNSMLEWYRKSGIGKAEFFRVALMMGANQLSN